MPVRKYQDPSKKTLKASESDGATKEPPGLRMRSRGSYVPVTSNSSEPTKKYNRDYLKDRWQTLSGRMMDYLHEGDRLETLMAETKLRDIGVMLGIATEKVLLLEGQPTSIVGQAEHKKLEELIPALLLEAKRRGSKIELTERKATVNLPTDVKST